MVEVPSASKFLKPRRQRQRSRGGAANIPPVSVPFTNEERIAELESQLTILVHHQEQMRADYEALHKQVKAVEKRLKKMVSQ